MVVLRKHQQKQLLDFVNTLDEAHAEIITFFSKKEYGSAIRLLSDCQAFVLQIIDFVEEIKGENTQTVSVLSNYYQTVYQMSVGIKGLEENALIQRLQYFTKEARKCINDELTPDKLEVLFLPYKASMWDSLESIWLEAKDDPQCDAFVVPIPFYEINRDNTVGEMHYEGDEYPQNVPIVDWRTYDIEQHRPDIVYIHYAYDDMAVNACVHPAFYSSRLREFCERLIYVPYFVSPWDGVDEHNARLPGVLNADYVIVQSEAVRQSYIKYYSLYDKALKWNGKYGKAETKFIALGSPKFDKVINARREDYELPVEWIKLIFKPDGTRKKIVFYNTHMFAWINNSEKYFAKIWSVFDYFRPREDVVLWWRPHPNTELNFRRTEASIYNMYRETVDRYKQEAWGIYDETADLNRAIAWSDMYYGDLSSLITMFAKAGKYQMIQNISNDYKDTYRIATVTNDSIICVSQQMNAVIAIDKETYDCQFIGSFPNEPIVQQALSVRAVFYSDKIYFAPFRADEINIYDTKKKEFSTIQLRAVDQLLMSGPAVNKTFHHNVKFRDAFLYKEYIYFFPLAYPAIVRLNSITNEIQYFNNFINDAVNAFQSSPVDGVSFFALPCISGTEVVMPIRCGNAFVVFNFETNIGKIEYFNLEDIPKNAFCTLTAFNDSKYWLLYKNVGWLIQVDIKNNSTLVVLRDCDYLHNAYMSYANGYIWISSPQENIKIDVKTNAISQADEMLYGLKKNSDDYILDMQVDNFGILRYVTTSGIYCERNLRETQPTTIVDVIKNVDLDSLQKKYTKDTVDNSKEESTAVFHESMLMTLDSLIFHLNSKEENIIKTDNNNTIGKSIWNFCRR